MRYYSELTKRFYDEVKECEKAEEAYKAELKKKEEEALQKSNARKEAAKKVEDAYNTLVKARKAYQNELNAFCKEHGSFHMTLNKDGIRDWIDSFWESWF